MRRTLTLPPAWFGPLALGGVILVGVVASLLLARLFLVVLTVLAALWVHRRWRTRPTLRTAAGGVALLCGLLGACAYPAWLVLWGLLIIPGWWLCVRK